MAPPPPLEVAPTVLVSGAKGGVGKSTVAMLLARRLAASGLAVGLLDADLTTPSQALLFGVREPPRVRDGLMEPAQRDGVRLLSTGMFGEADTPFVWHGLALRGFLLQALRDVRWGALDVLLVDMPAGTGETHVALLEIARVTAALLVTAPGAAARADLLRLAAMLRRLEVAVLGVVVNAPLPGRCPQCGHVQQVDAGGTDVPGGGLALLGRLPWLGDGDRLGGGAGPPAAWRLPPAAAALLDSVEGVLRAAIDA